MLQLVMNPDNVSLQEEEEDHQEVGGRSSLQTIPLLILTTWTR